MFKCINIQGISFSCAILYLDALQAWTIQQLEVLQSSYLEYQQNEAAHPSNSEVPSYPLNIAECEAQPTVGCNPKPTSVSGEPYQAKNHSG